jgi:serine/threonine-protein kinase
MTESTAPALPGWRMVRPLAEGAQSRVWIVQRGNTRAAAKVMRLVGDRGYPMAVDEQRWRLMREVTALQALEHAGCDGVVRVLDFGLRTGGGEEPWLVLPLHALGGIRWYDGTTFRYRERLCGRVGRVAALAGALARTLAAMHAHTPRIVHRDLHLGNVLLDAVGGAPVLADLGSADVDGYAPRPPVDAPILSTPWLWRAPELDHAPASPASDVYMLGGLIYEALSGGEVLSSVRGPGGGWTHEAPEHTLARFTDDPRIPRVNGLLRDMLDPEPAARIGAAEAACRCLCIERAGTPPSVSCGW